MDPDGTPQSGAQEPGANLTTPMLIGGAVLAVIVLGALYFFYERPEPTDTGSASAGAESWMPAATGSDDAAAIQAELEATDMGAFEQQMNVDAEAAASSI